MSEITDEMLVEALDRYIDECDVPISTDGMRAALAAVAPLIRSAALEEAARVADEIDQTYENHDLRWGVQRCAERIRALKDKDDRTPTEGDLL